MEIRIDQLGYRPQDEKKAVFTKESPKKFQIVNKKDKQIVFESSDFKKVLNPDADETDYIGDFTKVQEPGIYEVIADEKETSFSFCVGDTVYENVTADLLKMFYLQRCGMELTAEYAGEFAHKKCHDTIATVWDTDTKLDVSGGWHDAGDYGRYIVAAAVTVADLLMAYENCPSMFEKKLNIPESGNGIPDILNEVRYELEWMLKMQDQNTGEVYHKVTCFGFPGFVLPEEETEPLIVFPSSVTATATFAAAMAMVPRFYGIYDDAFGKKCLQAAIKAYDAMKKMNLPGGFKNPEGVITGEYGDDCDTDERYWAAAELYRATGDANYREDFEALHQQAVRMGYGWKEVGSFGNLAYLAAKYQKDEKIEKEIRESMILLADQLLDNSNKDGYGVSLGGQYVWGSNMEAANQGMQLCDAYRLTGEEKYRNAAREQVHYLFGKNSLNLCFVTGYGSRSPQHPHHRPSEALKKPMKGMLIGGPDSGLHDETAAKMLTGEPAAKCYVDELESYSTNEITIYWNAPLITLLTQI